jgi:hypothetical protein
MRGAHAYESPLAAEALYIQCLHICEQALGSEQHQVADLLYRPDNLYRAQGKYREVEPL